MAGLTGNPFVIFFAIIVAMAALIAVYVFFFGLPPAWADAMQDKITEEVGENAASNALRNQINKLPKSDRTAAEQLQRGIGRATGGDFNNPLGQFGRRGQKSE